MPAVFSRWWFWALIALLVVVIFFTFVVGSSEMRQEQSLTQFIEAAKAGGLTRVEVDGNELRYELRGDDSTYEAKMEKGDTVRQVLQYAGVEPEDFPEIELREASPLGNIIGIILQFIPLILIIGVLFFFLRQAAQAQRRWPFSMLVTNFDPVCRRAVNPGTSAGSSTFMNNTYYFCSDEHKQQFDSDPVKYLLEK
jgi:YHS domain-containing protein/preprotein translocase subunit YajC